MAHGLQVFNADGSLQFDSSNRLFRELLSLQSGTANGSATVPGSGTGTLVAITAPGSDDLAPPTVTVTGSTVAWNHSAPANQRDNSTIRVLAY